MESGARRRWREARGPSELVKERKEQGPLVLSRAKGKVKDLSSVRRPRHCLEADGGC